jgi:DNA replication protein DnaC
MACPLCDDTGWKPVEVDGVRRVARCDCWRQALAAELLAEARIPPRYKKCDLDNFRTENDSLVEAVRRARRFVDSFPVVDKGLFFVGRPGVGKTHLAVAMLKAVVVEKGARGIFYDTRELLRVIRSTYNPLVQTAEMDVLRPVMTADLLVLDDLGAEKPSEWVDETLNLIVNTRYNERRPTLFTSNYELREDVTDPDALAVRVGFRMWSRLHEMCDFVTLEGVDFRLAPPDATPEDLARLDKHGRTLPPSRGLPARAKGPARAQLRDKVDLKWTGGKAGR